MNSRRHKCAFIAIIGAPNAGKSTLLNNIAGSKVSIVTPKVQTTRSLIRAIYTQDNTQLVFIDTPGIFRPRKQLDKTMVKAAWSSTEGIGFVLLLVDAKRGICEETCNILNRLKKRESGNILVINKIDIVNKEKLLDLTAKLNDMCNFDKIFMISARTGDGTDDLKNFLCQAAPEGQWMYPEDQVADIPMKMLAAEITREKLIFHLNQEIPYKLMVNTEKWDEHEKSVNIYQTIYVTGESHKKIIVGKAGQGIKNIGEKSRRELSHLLGKKVNLFLFVKVKTDWMASREHYEMMGLGFYGDSG